MLKNSGSAKGFLVIILILGFSTASLGYSGTISSEGDTLSFSYQGDKETWSPPTDGYYRIELWGAEGGSGEEGGAGYGGNGGYVEGEIYLTTEDTLNVRVGEKGLRGDHDNSDWFRGQRGGYNGGGFGGNYDDSSSDTNHGGGGGGASDVRLNGDSLTDRIIVAGGGGGAGDQGSGDQGGYGGYPEGGNGGGSSGPEGYGGTQTSGGADGSGTGRNGVESTSGSFGYGGDVEARDNPSSGDESCAGGGGGGWYGGGAGEDCNGGGGGGGSSYYNPVLFSNFNYNNGANTGNGQAEITLVDEGTRDYSKEGVFVDFGQFKGEELVTRLDVDGRSGTSSGYSAKLAGDGKRFFPTTDTLDDISVFSGRESSNNVIAENTSNKANGPINLSLKRFEPETTVNRTYTYIGSSETFNPSISGVYEVRLWGAEGGYGNNPSESTVNTGSGKGGYIEGYVYLDDSDTVNVRVGGRGDGAQNEPDWYNSFPDQPQGGYNGGGDGGIYQSGDGESKHFGGAGGGASDIRLNGDSLTDRIIVAGGGGGAGSRDNTAGGGGYPNGEDGSGSNINAFGGKQYDGGDDGNRAGRNSVQSEDGEFGQGGDVRLRGSPNDGDESCAGGGGGGWYGGGAAEDCNGGAGGGGSSHADENEIWDVSYSNNVREGNGRVEIELVASDVNADSIRYLNYTSRNATNDIVQSDLMRLRKAGKSYNACLAQNVTSTNCVINQKLIYNLKAKVASFQNEFLFRNVRVPDEINVGNNQNFIPESTMDNSIKFSAGHTLPAQTMITRPFSDFDVVNVSIEKNFNDSYRLVSDILVRKYNVNFEGQWQDWSNRKTVTVQEIYNRDWSDSTGEMNDAWGIIEFNPEGFQNNDCSDVRLTDTENNVQDFTVNTCQDDYVQLEFNAPIDALEAKDFYVYYGNVDASDAQTSVERLSETEDFQMDNGITDTVGSFWFQSAGQKNFNMSIPQNVEFLNRDINIEGNNQDPQDNQLSSSIDDDYQEYSGIEFTPKRPTVIEGMDLEMASTTVDSEIAIRNMSSGSIIHTRSIPDNGPGSYYINFTDETLSEGNGDNIIYRPSDTFRVIVRNGQARRDTGTVTSSPMYEFPDFTVDNQVYSCSSDGSSCSTGDYPTLVSSIETISLLPDLTITYDNEDTVLYDEAQHLNTGTIDLSSVLQSEEWREGDPLDDPRVHEFTVDSADEGNITLESYSSFEFEHPVESVTKNAAACSVNPQSSTYFYIDKTDCPYLDRINVTQGQWFRLDYRFRVPGPSDFENTGDINSYNVSDTMVRYNTLAETEEFTSG